MQVKALKLWGLGLLLSAIVNFLCHAKTHQPQAKRSVRREVASRRVGVKQIAKDV
ncbi:hypothetical protein IQ272_14410 [Chroococcidiopsidales cyanobacterium LEGE 13417]|nr:hypothetical protein [Chroococcidiopsidales cyanobacterium LEGE 13417]